MSIQAVAWALEQDLPARPKLVLVSLANHANHTDGYCWLKAETIATEAACKRRSVYNFVGALIRNGYIRKSLRKGDDGKQRATDYWILFDREERPWSQDGSLDEDDGEGDLPETDTTEDAPQDVVEPVAPRAPGENVEPDAHDGTRQPVDIPNGAPGPVATACTRYESLNHPNLNQKQVRAPARVHGAAPRGYRPPPPPPLGADTEHEKNPVFVYEGTPAYEAWAKHEAVRRGRHRWHLTTRANIGGKWCSGWYFPTLFPPSEKPPPTSDPPLTDQELKDFR